ncbi:hypothetical protein B5P43_35415 [Bacillus sp. SRB_336]|nr:hypothetical protein B5P43_35415 [Bacillus sp. SRB_336]
MLLGVELAARRADTAAVIAAAVEAKTSTGAAHRPIAALLGRPASTVRGWLRGFTASAQLIATTFTGLVHRDGADPARLWPAPAPTPAAAALAAVTAYASVLGQRFAVATLAWQTAGLAAAGPSFFSTTRWHGRVQHELALMPGLPVGQSGKSTGRTSRGHHLSAEVAKERYPCQKPNRAAGPWPARTGRRKPPCTGTRSSAKPRISP